MDDFGLSENETSDEEGEGIFACAGRQHLDTVELATLSSGVEVQLSSTTGTNFDVSGKCRVVKLMQQLYKIQSNNTFQVIVSNMQNSWLQVNIVAIYSYI